MTITRTHLYLLLAILVLLILVGVATVALMHGVHLDTGFLNRHGDA